MALTKSKRLKVQRYENSITKSVHTFIRCGEGNVTTPLVRRHHQGGVGVTVQLE